MAWQNHLKDSLRKTFARLPNYVRDYIVDVLPSNVIKGTKEYEGLRGKFVSYTRRVRGQIKGLDDALDELSEELYRERMEREKRISSEINEKEQALMEEYRTQIKEMSELCESLNIGFRKQMEAIKEDADKRTAAAEKQVELAQGALSFRDQQIRKLRSGGLAYFLNLFEKELGLDKIIGLCLGYDFIPAYATPGFYKAFNVTKENLESGDMFKIFSGIDSLARRSIIESAKKRAASPLCLEIEDENEEKQRLELHYRYVFDKIDRDKVISTFIEFKEVSPGFWDKFSFSRNKGTVLLRKIFESPPEPNTGAV